MIGRLAICGFALLTPVLSQAQDLTLPTSARQLADRTSPLDSYAMPIAASSDGAIPVRAFEGRVERKTWRINGVSATTLQLLTPLRRDLEAQGFDLLFECQDRACGGFDFRFGTEIVPAPDMHVDIGNYRFLSAIGKTGHAISILVSRSGNAAYVQIIRVAPADQKSGEITVTSTPVINAQVDDVAATLEAAGHVILQDLEFDSGAGSLLPGLHESLRLLATYLDNHPDQRIALVGHTDSTGSLDANISLSQKRAEAVRKRLVESFAVDPARLDAEGMGYLAPIASNLTRDGREANRRVEAILLPAP